MNTLSSFSGSLLWRKMCMYFLASAFLVGFLSGVYVAASAGPVYVALMRKAPMSSVSIVGLPVLIAVPFLLTAFICKAGKTSLFLILCLVRAFLFGVASFSVYLAFGSAEWLVRTLLMFTDICSFTVLYWFWCRHIPGCRATVRRDLTVCLLVSFFAFIADYYFISPYLAKILHY